jgi:hypothetical protein
MKRNLIAVLFFLIGFVAMAQAPQKFNYQAVARDKNGQPLANQQVAIEIIIKQNNNAVFTEKQTTQTNEFGLITLEIGSKTPLSTVNWSQGSPTMDVKIDPNGGSNYELLGTIQLLAVPYALYANATNEQQRLQLNNNQLSITRADGTTAVNTVTLPTSGTGGATYSAGTGIAIDAQNRITNTGDNDNSPSNEIQTLTISNDTLRISAGNAVKLPVTTAGNVITSPVLSGKGTAADPLSIAAQGAVNGQFLKWNGTTWVPGTVNASGGDGWGTQAVETTPILSGKGTSAAPLSIAQQGAVNGQVLQWNGTTWVPGTINTSGGDGWGNQVAKTNTATISGDGSATNPLNLANNAVTSDKVVDGGIQGVDINQMNATNGQVLKWSQTQSSWLPQADNTGGTGGTGDNWGTQKVEINATLTGDGTTSSPLSIIDGGVTTAKLANNAVDATKLAPMNATDGQVLKWSQSQNRWLPQVDNTGGTGGTGDNWGTQKVEINATLTGDGTTSSPLSIAPQGAFSGQVLKWNGTSWAPANDATSTGGTTYTAGTGISISGTNVISNTGDISSTNEIQTLSVNGNQLTITGTGGNTVTLPTSTGGTTYTAGAGISIDAQNRITNTGVTSTDVGNDLSGTLPNPSVIGLRNIPISSTAPNSGQVLTYNGSQWIPQTPTTGGSSLWTEYTRGSEQGIVSNSQVVKIGDLGGLTLRPDGISMPVCPPNIVCILDGYTNIGIGSMVVQGSSSSTAPVAVFGGNVTAEKLNVNSKVEIRRGDQGNGSIELKNINDVLMIRISGGINNFGGISILGTDGSTPKASMFLAANGDGVVTANVKNFKVPHPIKKDKDIWYASLEGPEAAMYERGTATLKNGEAFIPYSETFQLMLSPNTATMNLTPQYWDTFGLAVIEKNDKGFRVKELKGGTGNFKFDWEVKGVRKGYENYQVVRDKEDNQSKKSESSIKEDELSGKAKVETTIKN